MDNGRVLKADESASVSVGDPVAWVGLLAIVLAIIAIALNLVDRKATEPGEAKTSDKDLWVESRDEEE